MERYKHYALMTGLLGIGLLLGACQTPSGSAHHGAYCAVEIRHPRTYSAAPPMEGTLARLGIIVTNTSDRYLMLSRIVPHDPTESEYSWQFDYEGELNYVLQQDRYVLRSKPLSTTPAYFNNGLLAPGEKVSVPLKTRTLNLPRTFTLEYLVLTREDVSNHVYVPLTSASPDEIQYQKSAGALPKNKVENPDFPGPTLRTVVAPPSILFQAEKMVLTVDFPSDPQPFSISAAMKAVGAGSRTSYTYFESGPGWILQSAPGQWWFANEQLAARIPALPLDTFFLLDMCEKPVEIELAGGTHEDFSGEYKPLVMSDMAGRPRYVLYLDKESVLPLLIAAGKKQLVCDFSTLHRLPRLTIKRTK